MTKTTIYIDESGTLPDPRDTVVIVAAVGTDLPNQLLDVVKSIRKYLKKTKENINEIKFYRAGENTRTRFLKSLVKKKIDIFILIVDKNKQKITDSPDNFSTLCWILLTECLLFYRKEGIDKLVFDKHFHREADQKLFNQSLTTLLGRKLPILHVDSKKDLRVNVADMVAGSILWFKTGKSEKFYKLIKDKIISEKTINWKEAKRKFISKKKV